MGLACLTTGTDLGREQPLRNQTLANLANVMGGLLSATSARNCTAKQKEEESALSVQGTGMDLTVRFVNQIIIFPQSRMPLDASPVKLVIATQQDQLICNVLLMESVNVSRELLETNVTVVKLTTGTSQKKQIQDASHVTVWWKEAREIGQAVTLLTVPVNASKILRDRDVTGANLDISTLILIMSSAVHPVSVTGILHSASLLRDTLKV